MLETIRSFALLNGLTLLCLHKRSAPVVAMEVWYPTGSAHDPAGKRGLSHILEHMMFRGSANVPPEAHAKRVAAVGGHANAFTAEDATAYVNAVPREHLDTVLELEADRMFSLLLKPDLFEIERKVIIEEYHTYMNNPVAKAMLEFRREFYGSHPYAVGPLGTLDEINSVTTEDCREYHQSRYAPRSAAVVVVGDFGSEEYLNERVSHWFGRDCQRQDPTASALPEIASVRQPMAMERRVEFDVPIQIHGYAAPAVAHPDTVALDVLMQILGQGESSRLTQALVHRAGAAVAVGGANQFLRGSGMSMLFALYTPDTSAGRIRDLLLSEVNRVRRDGVSESELNKAKNQSLAAHVFDSYSAEHLCHRLGLAHTIEGGAERWLERLKALEQLSVEQVTEAARSYWSPDSVSVLTLKPRRIRPMLVVAGLARRVANRLKFSRGRQ
jgi:zinc protease